MNKSIENYTLGDTIGRGSYAKVKRCVNRSTSLPYAIKIFNKLLLQKKKRLVAGRYLADFEQCLNEISAHLNFSHENIIGLYTIINQEHKVYVVQELGEKTLLEWNVQTASFEGEPFRKSYLLDIAKGFIFIQGSPICMSRVLYILT